jgi:hypothetical protein
MNSFDSFAAEMPTKILPRSMVRRLQPTIALRKAMELPSDMAVI